MTKKTKFTHTTADGVVETRTSARPYTHVIVGRRNLVRERAALNAGWEKTQRANHAYNVEKARTEVGTIMPGRIYPVSADEKAGAIAWLEQHGWDADAYVARRRQEELARIGEGDKGKEQVLQWSQSAANAHKGTGSWQKFWVDVRVVALGEQA